MPLSFSRMGATTYDSLPSSTRNVGSILKSILSGVPTSGRAIMRSSLGARREPFRLSGPNGGIFYSPTFGNNIFADRLNGRFVSHTSTAHHPKIRRRVIPHVGHLGTREGAATGHQINPLVAHDIILSRLPPDSSDRARDAFSPQRPVHASNSEQPGRTVRH